MTCQHDRDVQCFQDCPKCSQYIQQKECNNCGDETDKRYNCKTADGEMSVCWDCFIDSTVNTGLAGILMEYITAEQLEEIKDEYGEEIYG